MGKVRRSTILGLGLLLLYVGGCKVSCTTANISSLKLSKDEAGTTPTKEFAPGETVYAMATVSNNPSKVTIRFRLVYEKVEGQKENSPVPDSDKPFEIDGDGRALYYAKLPPGWPAGRYNVEAAMLVDGQQKDQKAETFTVTGGGATKSPAAPASPAPTANPPEEDTPEDNGNDSEEKSPPNQE
jgi:hypothetical protein